MATNGSSSSPMQDLFLFLALLVGLFVLWAATGGTERTPRGPVVGIGGSGELRSAEGFSLEGARARERRELEENIFDVQAELKKVQEELQEARKRGEASPYERMVSIRGGRPKERLAQTEYLELVAGRGNPIDVPITGWVFESIVTGQRGKIGGASRLPYPGIVNTEPTLFLSPGQSAIVTSGRSPIGVGFRVNQCSGYFEQFQDYAPRLRRECPAPLDEFDDLSPLPVTHVRIEDDRREICREFIRRNIDRCEINRVDLKDTELRLVPECQAFIEKTYTYSGCVANHQFEKEFYKDEWRVFLESPAELWREKREIIRLLDSEGRTVDIYDY